MCIRDSVPSLRIRSRYSVGFIPITEEKTLLKYFASLKPTLLLTAATGSAVFSKSALACSMRTAVR